MKGDNGRFSTPFVDTHRTRYSYCRLLSTLFANSVDIFRRSNDAICCGPIGFPLLLTVRTYEQIGGSCGWNLGYLCVGGFLLNYNFLVLHNTDHSTIVALILAWRHDFCTENEVNFWCNISFFVRSKFEQKMLNNLEWKFSLENWITGARGGDTDADTKTIEWEGLPLPVGLDGLRKRHWCDLT